MYVTVLSLGLPVTFLSVTLVTVLWLNFSLVSSACVISVAPLKSKVGNECLVVMASFSCRGRSSYCTSVCSPLLRPHTHGSVVHIWNLKEISRAIQLQGLLFWIESLAGTEFRYA